MKSLDQKYILQLDNIKASIQNSDILKRYLDEEEDEIYNELREAFEPEIHAVHEKIAREEPLQLIKMEEYLFDEGFEGLYLPRVLGYSVLRGKVDKTRVKYIRPQSHFSNVLNTICGSMNFELLKLRIGQAVQMGFALSSDIWITNLVSAIDNKRVKLFLESQKLEKYRDPKLRWTGFVKFKNQFKTLVYHTAHFPTEANQLQLEAPELSEFLLFRANNEFDNTNILDEIKSLIDNKGFRNQEDFVELLLIIGMCYPTKGELRTSYIDAMNNLRDTSEVFNQEYFKSLSDLLKGKINFSASNFKGFSEMIDRGRNDQITEYYNMMDVVNSKGYIHEDAIEAVREFYDRHEGRSIENECTRQIIFGHFDELISNLDVENYADYFEINKVFVSYMNIFSNQQFNQNVKDLSLGYVKRLIKRFTDKRGKDYQDIKKFVQTTFLELGFMKEKELVELFKTRRKKKTT